MAYENGYNMFDYCGSLFEKYIEDRLVFYKALQVFSAFESRKDYPYCTDELSDVCERVLGYDLGWISDFLWKYTVALSKDMIWDARNVLFVDKYPDGNMISEFSKEEGDKLVSNFKNDMEAFFITLTPLFEDLFLGETSASRIGKIAQKQTYGDEKTIRFIRKDGKTFDFSVTKDDIEKIIDAFSNMR